MLYDFENFAVLKPGPHPTQALNRMLDEVIAWSVALAPLRQERGELAA